MNSAIKKVNLNRSVFLFLELCTFSLLLFLARRTFAKKKWWDILPILLPVDTNFLAIKLIGIAPNLIYMYQLSSLHQKVLLRGRHRKPVPLVLDPPSPPVPQGPAGTERRSFGHSLFPQHVIRRLNFKDVDNGRGAEGGGDREKEKEKTSLPKRKPLPHFSSSFLPPRSPFQNKWEAKVGTEKKFSFPPFL